MALCNSLFFVCVCVCVSSIQPHQLTSSVVPGLGVHQIQGRGDVGTLTLAAIHKLTTVVGGSVGVDDLRVGVNLGNLDLSHGIGQVGHEVCLGQGNLLDDGRLVKSSAGGFRSCILNKEYLICRRVPV